MNAEHKAQSEATMSDLVEALHEAHEQIMDLRTEIAELRWIETALRERTRELGERVKELDCLYAISDCLGNPNKSLNEILQAIVNAIPSGFQFPEQTSVVMNISGQRFCSCGFRQSADTVSCDLSANGRHIGNIQAFFSPPPKLPDRPAFLPEEDHLLRAVAKWIGEIVEHRSGSGQTKKPKTRPPYALFARR